MRIRLYISILSVLLITACKDTRIHEHEEWATFFTEKGIEDGCFIMRDHNHETVHYYNKERTITRFTPASTFKIFNSLVALEIPKAPDEQFLIVWDSVNRRPEWDKDLTMREAFTVSSVPYYQEMARRIGFDYMQHFLDTANYGNRNAGGAIDEFWLNDSLQISADEQVGFLKKLYFNELPFSERSQRIVRSMMLREQKDNYNLYYKTGWGAPNGAEKETIWIVGFIERIAKMEEHEKSMNKSDIRKYPYFFALNFSLPSSNDIDYAKYTAIREDILKGILKDYGAITTAK
ncbi:MAG: penicillin-binding transpeptidase domain-containing protein [Flavipsychrobacter sp.]